MWQKNALDLGFRYGWPISFVSLRKAIRLINLKVTAFFSRMLFSKVMTWGCVLVGLAMSIGGIVGTLVRYVYCRLTVWIRGDIMNLAGKPVFYFFLARFFVMWFGCHIVWVLWPVHIKKFVLGARGVGGFVYRVTLLARFQYYLGNVFPYYSGAVCGLVVFSFCFLERLTHLVNSIARTLRLTFGQNVLSCIVFSSHVTVFLFLLTGLGFFVQWGTALLVHYWYLMLKFGWWLINFRVRANDQPAPVVVLFRLIFRVVLLCIYLMWIASFAVKIRDSLLLVNSIVFLETSAILARYFFAGRFGWFTVAVWGLILFGGSYLRSSESRLAKVLAIWAKVCCWYSSTQKVVVWTEVMEKLVVWMLVCKKVLGRLLLSAARAVAVLVVFYGWVVYCNWNRHFRPWDFSERAQFFASWEGVVLVGFLDLVLFSFSRWVRKPLTKEQAMAGLQWVANGYVSVIVLPACYLLGVVGILISVLLWLYTGVILFFFGGDFFYFGGEHLGLPFFVLFLAGLAGVRGVFIFTILSFRLGWFLWGLKNSSFSDAVKMTLLAKSSAGALIKGWVVVKFVVPFFVIKASVL